jgi:hypothetical protein
MRCFLAAIVGCWHSGSHRAQHGRPWLFELATNLLPQQPIGTPLCELAGDPQVGC